MKIEAYTKNSLSDSIDWYERVRFMAKLAAAIITVLLIGYSVIGTAGRVDEIKLKAPPEIALRNWKILRYEGFQYGSWGNHGGKVWYHVANIDNPNIQYRIFVTIWDNELQYHYGAPETLQRIEVNHIK